MKKLTHKIGCVKTYYNEDSDMGHTKLYRKDHGDSFEVAISKTEGFPPVLETGEENCLIIVFYKMIKGKMVFDHGVYKTTLPSGKRKQGKIETEKEVERFRVIMGLDCVDTINITDDINNYDLLTAN